MDLSYQLFTTVILHLLCSIPSRGLDDYSITRSTSKKYDIFQVPRCIEPCSSYVGANTHDNSSCKCACKYESSTFGLHNSIWLCQDNAISRRQAGCTYNIEGNIANNPVAVLPSVAGGFKVILPVSNCKMEYSSSQYRRCDGTWTRLDSLVASPGPFSIFPIIETITSNVKYRYTIKSSSEISKFTGQLITLTFKCKGTPSCVLFKVAGLTKCPVTLTQPTTASQSSTTPSTTAALTTFTTTSTKSLTTTATVTTGSSAGPGSVPKTKEPQTTVKVRTGYPTTQTQSPVPGDDSPYGSSEKNRLVGVIAAVVAVVIIFIIILLMLGYIFWKRKKGENVWFLDQMSCIVRKARREPSIDYRRNEPEESIYAEIPEQSNDIRLNDSSRDREVYSFAFEDPNSAYGQAVSNDGDSLYEEAGTVIDGQKPFSGGRMNGFVVEADQQHYEGFSRNESEDNLDSDHPGYNVLEQPDKAEYKEPEKPHEPVYNDWNNQNQPEYNILENPNSLPYNKIGNPSSPVYNELTNPNSPPYKEIADLKSPIYNEPYGPKSPGYNTILEEAKSKELENQDMSKYLALIGPNEKHETSNLRFFYPKGSTPRSDSGLTTNRNRRRAPSPPRRENDTVSNVVLRAAKDRGKSKGEENNEENRASIYEPLQSNVRPLSVYEVLDRSALSRKC